MMFVIIATKDNVRGNDFKLKEIEQMESRLVALSMPEKDFNNESYMEKVCKDSIQKIKEAFK